MGKSVPITRLFAPAWLLVSDFERIFVIFEIGLVVGDGR